MKGFFGFVAVVLVSAGLVASAGGSTTPAISRSQADDWPILRGGCYDSSPCRFPAGRHQLGLGSVLPGLRLVLPRGWRSSENTPGEFNLIPPGHPKERLFVWLDMRAVKSTGSGHGTVLPKVGARAADLIAWLQSDRDFEVVSGPTPSTLIHGVKTTSLVVGIAKSANYGDPQCPSNPRCADLFTNPTEWGTNFYGIGAPEEARLYIGTIKRGGTAHTFFVTLDAEGPHQMQRLTLAAKPIITSLRLPKAIVGA